VLKNPLLHKYKIFKAEIKH